MLSFHIHPNNRHLVLWGTVLLFTATLVTPTAARAHRHWVAGRARRPTAAHGYAYAIGEKAIAELKTRRDGTFARLAIISSLPGHKEAPRVAQNCCHVHNVTALGYNKFCDDLDHKLLKAAERGDLEAVKRLVTRGASVNIAQENGWTALMLAAQDARVSVAAYLLAHGADVHRRSILYNDVDALMLAAEAGNAPICRMLLVHGMSVDETDVSGNTLLILALGNGNLTPKQEYDITKLMLKNGVDVNARNYFHETALDYTKRSRFELPLTAAAKLLIAAGGKK